MTPKMFLDIVGFITTSKISILKTFQGGGLLEPPLMSNSVKICLLPKHNHIYSKFQSDLWKLVLVLTLTTGLGVSCFLILIIVKVCGLYKGKTSKPHQGDTGDGTNHVDLDSDTVDYDINTQLYTPLPEPKIMQISPDYSVATANVSKIAFSVAIAIYDFTQPLPNLSHKLVFKYSRKQFANA